MKAKFPCNECYPKECYEFCIRYKKYMSRLIKSYTKYGNKSLLWKHSQNELSPNMRRRIKSAVDTYFNIGLKNTKSGKGITINRKGTILPFNEDDVVGSYHDLIRN